MVRYLLAAGADPNIRAADDSSPLMAASFKGNYAIVEMLLKNKASFSAKTKAGDTALSVAVGKKLTAIVGLLKEAGATE